jgi:S1-C subfamily serine protease
MDVKDIDAPTAQKYGINTNIGIIVDQVMAEGPAEVAGLRSGDIILRANERDLESKAMFDELIAYHRPGDKIKILYKRENKEMATTINLLNREGTVAIMKKGTISSEALGADFQPLPKIEKDKLGLSNGYRISNIRQGRIASMGIQEGFIITSLNRKVYDKVDDLIKALETVRGQVVIEGVFPNGGRGVFSFYTY